MGNTFRWVICVDVDAESLEESYSKLYRAMGHVEAANEDIQWESSDEAFDPDGEQLDPEELSRTRMRVISKIGEDR